VCGLFLKKPLKIKIKIEAKAMKAEREFESNPWGKR
jgi:hypothetical protein